jgi:hypothetical protein
MMMMMMMMSIDINVDGVRMLNSGWQVEVYIHIRFFVSVRAWLMGIADLGFRVYGLYTKCEFNV